MKTMRRGFRMFEFLLVTAIIGVIVLFGISRYLELGRETQRLGFELLAHNFTASVAGARAQWLIQSMQGGTRQYLDVDGIRLYMNEQGWPARVGDQIDSVNQDLTAKDCLKLWQALLRNAVRASVEGEEARGEAGYHISLSGTANCRYELVTEFPDGHYFDYSPTDGKVTIYALIGKETPDV
jgi:type II secretory pathway pseudopilin PulG